MQEGNRELVAEAAARRRIAMGLWVLGVISVAAFTASFWVTQWRDAGLTPFGVLGFVVTAFGVALAAAIYWLQKQASVVEARTQEGRHRSLERQMADVRSALDDAQENKTGARLTPAQAELALDLTDSLRSLPPALVLWVDDHPEWVADERRVLDGLGNRSVLVRSTEEAGLLLGGENRFDLIVTDMGRGDDLLAGYDLLELVGQQPDAPPVILYSNSDDPDHRRQWLDAGGSDSSYEPLGLFAAVNRSLENRSYHLNDYA